MPTLKPRYELQVSVRIVDYQQSGQGISVDERFAVEAEGFMEICGILGKFHELAQNIKSARAYPG
jgi:hypothetical protein